MYRRDIDGIRALSVLSVIIYHASFTLWNKPILSGGFVGVDVFFVISGYLICRNLLKELSCNQKINIMNFYFRRIKRILPPLLIMIIITFPIAWKFLLPRQMAEYSNSIISSILFYSNFYFFSSIDYWDIDSKFKILLHTWSLSLEEQFYILFPFFIVIFVKLKTRIAWFFGTLIFIVSLYLTLVLNSNYSVFKFYLLPCRVWEFMAGILIGVYHHRTDIPSIPNNLGRLIPFIGLIFLFYSFTYADDSNYPSYQTLFPVAGTLLLLLYYDKNHSITKILSSKLPVFIGLMSYSLYLWHQPIFAFFRITTEQRSNMDKIVWTAIALVISIISYFCVERPLKEISFKKGWILKPLSAISIIVIIFSSIVVGKKGVKERFSNIFGEDFHQQPWYLSRDSSGKICFNRTKDFCRYSLPNNEKEIFLIGDSTLESISPYLTPKLTSLGYNVTSMNMSACIFMIGFNGPKEVEECSQNFQDQRWLTLNKYPGATVILGGTLSFYLANNHLNFNHPDGVSGSAGYLNTIFKLLDSGYKIILLGDTPRSNENVSERLVKFLYGSHSVFNFKPEEILNLSSISFSDFLSYAKEGLKLLESTEHRNLIKIYPHKLFCNTYLQKKCVFNNGEKIFFVDIAHPAKLGSEMISDLIVKQFQTQKETVLHSNANIPLK